MEIVKLLGSYNSCKKVIVFKFEKIIEMPGQAEIFLQTCCNFLLPATDTSKGSPPASVHIPCCPHKTYVKASRVTKPAERLAGSQAVNPHLPADKENSNPNASKKFLSPFQTQSASKKSPPCGIGIIWRIEHAQHLNKEVLVVDSQEPGSLEYQNSSVQDGDILVELLFK